MPCSLRKAPDLGDRLGVQHHGASEDDELGPMAGDQLLRGGHVDAVGVALAHGEVHDRRRVGARVARPKSRRAPIGWALK